MHRGTNLPRMGDYNQAVVLDLIRRSGDGLSRAQLARRAGLSPQTISNITLRLVRQGLVVEEGARARSGPGRPGTLLRADASSKFAVGVHFDPGVVTVVLVDMLGNIRSTLVQDTDDPPTPDRIVDEIGQMVTEVVTSSRVDIGRVLGVGVASPGPIDIARGVVSRPPLLKSWTHEVPLRDHVQRVTGLPTLLDKDVSAAAFAHLWFPASGTSGSFVFMYLGAGSAMATVLNNEVVRGKSGNAGDVGSLLVDVTGHPDTTGLPGTLGQLAQAKVIVAEAKRQGALDDVEVNLSSHRDVYRAFKELGRRAEDGAPVAARVIERATAHFMKGARDLAHLLEIDRIIVGGPMWAAWPSHALEVAQAYVDNEVTQGTLWNIEVMSSPWGEEVGAIGGASIVLEQAFAPRPAALLLDAPRA